MPSVRFGAEEALSRALCRRERVRALIRTTGGIEELAAEELRTAGHQVLELSRRQLIVALRTAQVIARPPRLVDDLFLIAADVPDPGRRRDGLDTLSARLNAAMQLPVPIRPREPFAVSGSFVGRRNFSRYAVEDTVGELVQRVTKGNYVSRGDGTVVPPARRADLRVVLDGTRAILGIRPFAVPLHRRDWRASTVPGSLHPPVAAALAQIADIQPGDVVLDPFTGAGTLLLEASQIESGARYIGIDRDQSALHAARANASGRSDVQWHTGDARDLSQFTSTADRIITNPPWGRQQPIADIAPYIDQWRIALKPNGVAVAILNPAQAASFARAPRWKTLRQLDVTVAGQAARIVSATPGGNMPGEQ
ncbi:hypothetical protein GCM10028798_24380 [Humibacter antri]